MASPPYQGATSPPSSAQPALPRQRPTLSVPTNIQRRKPSITSTTSSNHPLRQTSFPPADSLEAQHQQAEDDALARFSPDADDAVSLESDEDITSAISGPAGDDAFASSSASRKRKRERGAEPRRARGRPPKNSSLRRGSTSVANSSDARSVSKRAGTAAGTATAGGEASLAGDAGDEEEEDDDDDDGDGGADARGAAGLLMDAAELEQENKRRYLFREAVPPAHQNRYDAYNKVKLRTSDVRRLVNATLSQSVPQNVVTVVGAYTKMFAGMLVESAREVQTEWMAVAKAQADGAENLALKKLKMMRAAAGYEDVLAAEADRARERKKAREEKEREKRSEDVDAPRASNSRDGDLGNGDTDAEDGAEIKADKSPETHQPNGITNGQTNGHSDGKSRETSPEVDEVELVQPGAWGLAKNISESSRGPLLPDHLREALRRYKRSRGGGNVGFTGLSLEGREVAAPRMGGRRLFR